MAIAKAVALAESRNAAGTKASALAKSRNADALVDCGEFTRQVWEDTCAFYSNNLDDDSSPEDVASRDLFSRPLLMLEEVILRAWSSYTLLGCSSHEEEVKVMAWFSILVDLSRHKDLSKDDHRREDKDLPTDKNLPTDNDSSRVEYRGKDEDLPSGQQARNFLKLLDEDLPSGQQTRNFLKLL